MKASHRAIDDEKSSPWAPFHPHTEAEQMLVDEVIRYAIELSPTSNVFKSGHRLWLTITAADNPVVPGDDVELGFGHRPWHVVRNATVLHRVHHDREHPSHLLLPIIPSED